MGAMNQLQLRRLFQRHFAKERRGINLASVGLESPHIFLQAIHFRSLVLTCRMGRLRHRGFAARHLTRVKVLSELSLADCIPQDPQRRSNKAARIRKAVERKAHPIRQMPAYLSQIPVARFGVTLRLKLLHILNDFVQIVELQLPANDILHFNAPGKPVLFQSLGPRDEFGNLLRDVRLPGAVVLLAEALDQVAGVLGGGLHGDAAGDLLAHRRIQETFE